MLYLIGFLYAENTYLRSICLQGIIRNFSTLYTTWPYIRPKIGPNPIYDLYTTPKNFAPSARFFNTNSVFNSYLAPLGAQRKFWAFCHPSTSFPVFWEQILQAKNTFSAISSDIQPCLQPASTLYTTWPYIRPKIGSNPIYDLPDL